MYIQIHVYIHGYINIYIHIYTYVFRQFWRETQPRPATLMSRSSGEGGVPFQRANGSNSSNGSTTRTSSEVSLKLLNSMLKVHALLFLAGVAKKRLRKSPYFGPETFQSVAQFFTFCTYLRGSETHIHTSRIRTYAHIYTHTHTA